MCYFCIVFFFEYMKDIIVQTAIRQFHQYGIRNVSIDNICSEVRISKKTFYTCFSSKEELVEAAIILQQQEYIEKCMRNEKSKNAIEIFINNIREVKKAMENSPFLFWHDVEKFYPALHQKYDQIKMDYIKESFETNILKGIQEGYYRDDLDVELLSFFHSVQMRNTFEMMIQSNKKFTMKRLLDFFIDLMIHLIANEKGLQYIRENYTDRR